MPADPSPAKTIFVAAIEMPAAERAAYLDAACAGDASLRQRVDALLTAHDMPDSFLERPAVEPPPYRKSAGDTMTLQADRGGAEPALPAANAEAATSGAALDDDDEDSALAFLEPSARPGSRGRLGHYEVLEVLGKGGFGTVLKAFDDGLHRMVAIKVMSAQMAATSPAHKRLREARAAAGIRDPHVVTIHAVEEQPIPYLVMEYIAGETLQQRLNRHGPLDVPQVLRLGQQIAGGLAAAHAMGLIHRDIKPSNILLEEGVERHVKITDFGLARAADDASLTQSGVIAGTPMFMAPEQAQGLAIDQRADLFSLGSVLYTMVSGRPPFRAATTLAVLKRVTEDTPRPIEEIIPETPVWLRELIAKLHAKQPGDRIQSAREVAELLGRRLSDPAPRTAHAAPPSPVAVLSEADTTQAVPVRRAGRRRWIGLGATVAACLLLLGGLALSDATGVTNLYGRVALLFSAAPQPPDDGRPPDPPVPPPVPVAPKAPGSEVAWLRERATLRAHKGPVFAIAIANDGKLLATGGADRKVRVWDVARGALLRTLDYRFGEPKALAFSQDGAVLFAGGGEDYGRAGWSTADWTESFGRADRDGWELRGLAAFKDAFIAAGKTDGGYHFCGRDGEIAGGRFLAAPDARCIAARADGQRIAIGLGAGKVELWLEAKDENEQPRQRALEGHTGAVLALAFCAHSPVLASGSADKTIRFWNSDDGAALGTAVGHDGAVVTLALSPDGKHVVSGSADRTVRLWDHHGTQVGAAQPLAVAAVAWSPDGQSVVGAATDGTVKLWQITVPR